MLSSLRDGKKKQKQKHCVNGKKNVRMDKTLRKQMQVDKIKQKDPLWQRLLT